MQHRRFHLTLDSRLRGAPLTSRTHLRNTFSWRSRSRAAWATETPRSFTSLTASSLNSRLNFRLCIPTLQFRQTPYLGVHETGSSSTITITWKKEVAGREGFEPPERLRVRRFSRPEQSAALPPTRFAALYRLAALTARVRSSLWFPAPPAPGAPPAPARAAGAGGSSP